MEKFNEVKLYCLLEKILKSAEEKNKSEVLRLNHSIDHILTKSYSSPNRKLLSAYDNCRQSCVLPFTFLKDSYNVMIVDARKRFRKIKKPY